MRIVFLEMANPSRPTTASMPSVALGSLPPAALGLLLGLANDGNVSLSQGSRVSSIIIEQPAFQSPLGAPCTPLCFSWDFGDASSRPSDVVSRTCRPLQFEDASAKGEHAELISGSPHAVVLGRTYFILEECSAINLQNSFRSLDLPGWSNRKLFDAESNNKLNDARMLPLSPHKPLRQVQGKTALQNPCLPSSQICRGKRISDLSASFQIQIKLISGKTLLQ